jgi:ADP-heptose:LPS heptosyltransferase
MKKLLLKNRQSPGDIVMLTAAVRDLHRSHPGQFATDVRTPCGALWENNPHLTALAEDDAEAEGIECGYPLIHRSNGGPWHFIHGFTQFLSGKLGVPIQPTDFKGDIHLSPKEKGWMSQVQEITRQRVPYWIVGAGGKYDFTAKWWAHERWQAVVERFAGRILFVQVGEKGHHHPPLAGVLDLRGKTTLRQLVRLVHHAQGVLCPVTLLMHLAAAVEVGPGMPKNRPCVVVAGGREPAQWEAYPHHQYLHTNGALRCCDHGGCWKARVVPLGDGDRKDEPRNLCVDVVHLRDPVLGYARKARDPVPAHASANAPGRDATDFLPRCMDMISAEDVIRRIELYFDGGAVRYLTDAERRVCEETVSALEWEAMAG